MPDIHNIIRGSVTSTDNFIKIFSEGVTKYFDSNNMKTIKIFSDIKAKNVIITYNCWSSQHDYDLWYNSKEYQNFITQLDIEYQPDREKLTEILHWKVKDVSSSFYVYSKNTSNLQVDEIWNKNFPLNKRRELGMTEIWLFVSTKHEHIFTSLIRWKSQQLFHQWRISQSRLENLKLAKIDYEPDYYELKLLYEKNLN